MFFLHSQKVLGDCWWYSIEDFTWTEREINVEETTEKLGITEPTPRHSHSLVSNTEENCIYMIGGLSENDASLCENAFWVYDCVTDKWSNVEEFNYFSRRIGHVAVKHKNNLVIVGGYGADSSYSLDFFAIVFDLETKIIRPITPVQY